MGFFSKITKPYKKLIDLDKKVIGGIHKVGVKSFKATSDIGLHAPKTAVNTVANAADRIWQGGFGDVLGKTYHTIAGVVEGAGSIYTGGLYTGGADNPFGPQSFSFPQAQYHPISNLPMTDSGLAEDSTLNDGSPKLPSTPIILIGIALLGYLYIRSRHR